MTADAEQAGAAVYNKGVLSVYDVLVLGISNRLAWRCPSQRILDFYNRNISANHLDIGVGTGYFLDKCQFPSTTPRLALLDLNPNSLAASTRRLSRYQPVAYLGSVLDPISVGESFDSIGLNYLLHCLPGAMRDKAVVFQHAKAVLKPGGVVFGTTILGQGVQRNVLAKALMATYNRRRIFSNE